MSLPSFSQFESLMAGHRSVSGFLIDISASEGLTTLVARTNGHCKRWIGPGARSRNALISSSAVALFPTGAPPHCRPASWPDVQV
jgi:hypothetical protein